MREITTFNIPNLALEAKCFINTNERAEICGILKFNEQEQWTKKYSSEEDCNNDFKRLGDSLPYFLSKEKSKINEELYKIGFRDQGTSFIKSLNESKLLLLPAISHMLGSFLLMSKEGEALSMGLPDNGIWSKEYSRDAVGTTTRAMGAILPLVTNIIDKYTEDNKYSWEKSSYNNIKTALAGVGLTATAATMGETYAFNRGRLPEDKIYQPEALFENKNYFESVFLNRFSSPFTIEQIATTIKNLTKIAHHGCGLISEKTNKNIEDISTRTSAIAATSAYINLGAGVLDNSFGEKGKIKNTIGVHLAAGWANYEALKAAKSSATDIKNKYINRQEEQQDNLTRYNNPTRLPSVYSAHLDESFDLPSDSAFSIAIDNNDMQSTSAQKNTTIIETNQTPSQSASSSGKNSIFQIDSSDSDIKFDNKETKIVIEEFQ